MTLNFMIVVDDAGELKSVSAAELQAAAETLTELLTLSLNEILDKRAIDAGEYEPDDDDLPIQVSINGIVR